MREDIEIHDCRVVKFQKYLTCKILKLQLSVDTSAETIKFEYALGRPFLHIVVTDISVSMVAPWDSVLPENKNLYLGFQQIVCY